MRKYAPGLAVAAAVGLAAFTVHDALAGNVSNIPLGMGFGGTISSWVSIKMTPADRLTFVVGGPPVPNILLIDDITYSVDVNPWAEGGARGPRVACFQPGDLFGVLEVQGNSFASPYPFSMTGAGFLWFQHGTIAVPPMGGLINWDVTTWREAKGDWSALELINRFVPQPPGVPFEIPFDRISHTTNAQLNGREVWFNDDAMPRNMCLGTSISISQSIVNTSESRHYQTPHICVPGTEVIARTPSNATPYVNAAIYIKGRVVQCPLPPTPALPSVNGEVTVGP